MNKLVLWVMNRQLILSLLGVPRPQRQLIMKTYKGGLSQYLADNLRHIFTNLPIHENYFWRVYLKGEYSPECCPNYLKEANFNLIRSRVDKIQTYNTSFAQFLQENPGQYSHFILLDHQDWLASYAPELLEQEWQLILANSKPGTLILMRSASINIDFLPPFVLNAVDVDQDLTPKLHKTDRVGTYGCTYLMKVK